MVALATCWMSCSDDDKDEPDPTIPTMDEIALTITVSYNGAIFSPFDPDYFDEEEELEERYKTYHKIPQDWEVNWGDGQTTNSTTHQYDLKGTYQVIIKGTGITSIQFNDTYPGFVEKIDVTKAPNLVILDVSYQNLTTLDLSKNTKLTDLDCETNQLTSLDLSKNTKLTDLGCYGNQLTLLDLSKNTELIYLCCGNNPFTQESVNNLLNSLPMGKYNNGEPISILRIDRQWDVSIAEEKGWRINVW